MTTISENKGKLQALPVSLDSREPTAVEVWSEEAQQWLGYYEKRHDAYELLQKLKSSVDNDILAAVRVRFPTTSSPRDFVTQVRTEVLGSPCTQIMDAMSRLREAENADFHEYLRVTRVVRAQLQRFSTKITRFWSSTLWGFKLLEKVRSLGAAPEVVAQIMGEAELYDDEQTEENLARVANLFEYDRVLALTRASSTSSSSSGGAEKFAQISGRNQREQSGRRGNGYQGNQGGDQRRNGGREWRDQNGGRAWRDQNGGRDWRDQKRNLDEPWRGGKDNQKGGKGSSLRVQRCQNNWCRAQGRRHIGPCREARRSGREARFDERYQMYIADSDDDENEPGCTPAEADSGEDEEESREAAFGEEWYKSMRENIRTAGKQGEKVPRSEVYRMFRQMDDKEPLVVDKEYDTELDFDPQPPEYIIGEIEKRVRKERKKLLGDEDEDSVSDIASIVDGVEQYCRETCSEDIGPPYEFGWRFLDSGATNYVLPASASGAVVKDHKKIRECRGFEEQMSMCCRVVDALPWFSRPGGKPHKIEGALVTPEGAKVRCCFPEGKLISGEGAEIHKSGRESYIKIGHEKVPMRYHEGMFQVLVWHCYFEEDERYQERVPKRNLWDRKSMMIRRYGRISEFERALAHEITLHLTKSDSCGVCDTTKARRAPAKRNNGQERREEATRAAKDNAGYIVQADFLGPMGEGFDDSKVVLNAIDVGELDFVWTEPLQDRKAERLVKTVKDWEKQDNLEFLRIHSDDAKEFRAAAKMDGRFRQGRAYRPQDQGKVERFNMTMELAIMVLLRQLPLASCWWPVLAKQMVLVRNTLLVARSRRAGSLPPRYPYVPSLSGLHPLFCRLCWHTDDQKVRREIKKLQSGQEQEARGTKKLFTGHIKSGYLIEIRPNKTYRVAEAPPAEPPAKPKDVAKVVRQAIVVPSHLVARWYDDLGPDGRCRMVKPPGRHITAGKLEEALGEVVMAENLEESDDASGSDLEDGIAPACIQEIGQSLGDSIEEDQEEKQPKKEKKKKRNDKYARVTSIGTGGSSGSNMDESELDLRTHVTKTIRDGLMRERVWRQLFVLLVSIMLLVGAEAHAVAGVSDAAAGLNRKLIVDAVDSMRVLTEDAAHGVSKRSGARRRSQRRNGNIENAIRQRELQKSVEPTEFLDPGDVSMYLSSSEIRGRDVVGLGEWQDPFGREQNAVLAAGKAEDSDGVIFLPVAEARRLGYTIARTRTVCTVKRDGRRKVRVVVLGNRVAAPSGETYSGVARSGSMRLLVTLYTKLVANWKKEGSGAARPTMSCVDVDEAFTQAKLPSSRKVAILPPPEWIQSLNEWPTDTRGDKQVLVLKKALYGLKTSPADFGKWLKAVLATDLDLRPLEADSSVYVSKDCLVLVYVDDLLVLNRRGNDGEFFQKLRKRVRTKPYQTLSEENRLDFLSLYIVERKDGVDIEAPRRDRKLEKMITGHSGLHAISRVCDVSESDEAYDGEIPFRSVVGCVSYAAVSTSPDLSFAVSQLAKGMSRPTKSFARGAREVVAYCRRYPVARAAYPFRCTKDLRVVGFADATWASEPTTAKSIAAHVIGIAVDDDWCRGKDAILREPIKGQVATMTAWTSSILRGLPSLSSTEAEVSSAIRAAREVLWQWRWLVETSTFHGQRVCPGMLLVDNASTVAIVQRSNDSRTKSIRLKLEWMREASATKLLDLRWVSRKANIADTLCKTGSHTHVVGALAAVGFSTTETRDVAKQVYATQSSAGMIGDKAKKARTVIQEFIKLVDLCAKAMKKEPARKKRKELKKMLR